MHDSLARRRVERLLAGEYRSDDLTHLFLFARDRCDGRELVQEMGDFCAHQSERTKGLFTKRVKLQYSSFLFYLKYYEKPFLLADVDPCLIGYLLHNVNNFSVMDFKSRQVSRKEGHKLVEFISTYATKNLNGNLSLIKDGQCVLDRNQLHALEQISNVHLVQPSFSASNVVAEFFATLKSHSLISKREIRSAEKLSTVIELFCLSVIHRTTILLPGHDPVTIVVQTGLEDGNLNAATYCKTSPLVTIVTTFLETSLQSQRHCTKELLKQSNFDNIWLEVNQKGQLGLL